MKKKFLVFFTLTLFAGVASYCQNVAIKTNLLSDVAADVNLGIEAGLAPKWTLDITGDYNGWDVKGHKWKHWYVQPEARYWFCDTFEGHFIGIHAIGGQYNFGNLKNNIKFLGSDFSSLTDHRYEGWAAGAGFAYGYDWILAKHWNLELEIGIGWIYTRFTKYRCEECGSALVKNKPHNYFGPTKLAINLEYLF